MNTLLQSRGDPPKAYLGTGFGLNHLAPAGSRAIKTAGFVCANRDADGRILPGCRDTASVAESISSCNAVIVLIALPPNDGNQRMSQEEQALCMDLLEAEYESACALRGGIGEVNLSKEAVTAAQREREIIILAPQQGCMTLQGYDNTVVHQRYAAFADRVRELNLAPHLYQNSDQLEQKVCGTLFQKLPNLARATIMLSSTGKDHTEEHQVIEDALRMLGQTRIEVLSYLKDRISLDAFTASMNYVEQCTLYLGLLKARISPAVRDGKSLTELEYDKAFELGKQCGFFLANHSASATLQGLKNATPDDHERIEAFKQLIQRNGTPRREYGTHDELRSAVFEMLSWLNRPSPDQQALAPPDEHKHRWCYVAHPYVLMEGQSSVRRETWTQRFDQWRTDAKGPGLLLLQALGGMGKSAVTWAWLEHVRQLKEDRPHVMWWSFYARNAGPAQFAAHALWWLQGETETASSLLDAGDLGKLFDALLQELKQGATDYLLVLDGIERVLIAYLDFRGEVAPDEGLTLDVTLRQRAKEFATRHQVSEAQALRYLRKFTEGGIEESAAAESERVADRISQPDDESAFARFLSEAAALPRVKILVTSRFEPAVVESMQAQSPPLATVERLQGLTEQEARSLWLGDAGKGLQWEEDELPEELGGGTLAQICCEALGGHALPVSMLAELVAFESKAGGSFAKWKSLQHGPIRRDSWVLSSQDEGERAAHAQRLQTQILLLTLQHIRANEGDWEVLSTIMLGNGGMSSFADLMQKFVGPGKQFAAFESLFAALNRLRKWKIIGASKHSDRYDAHPVLRRALQEYAPDDDPCCRREAERLRQAWKQEDDEADHEDRETSFKALERRWSEVLGFINLGAAGLAFDLYDGGVESRLRYRTQANNLVPSRAAWLRSALAVIDQFLTLKGDSDSLLVFRGLLQTALADNMLLLGEITEAVRMLEAIPVPGNDTTLSPPSRVMLAGRSLKLGHARAHQARRYDAITAYADAIDLAAEVGRSALPLSNVLRANARRISEWARYGMAEELASLHGADIVREVDLPAPGTDADADAVRVEVALLAGDAERTRKALSAFCDACNQRGSRLNLGNLSASLFEATAWLRLGISSYERVEPSLAETEKQACEQGFISVQRRARLLDLEMQLKSQPSRAHRVAREVMEIAQAGSAGGDATLEAEARSLAAEAMLAENPPRAAPAREEAKRAFTLASQDGMPWVPHTLQHRTAQVCESCGVDWHALLKQSRSQIDVNALRRKFTENQQTTAPIPPGAPSPEPSEEAIADARARAGWDTTTGSARKWWENFEQENQTRKGLILLLLNELTARRSSIADFFLASIYSATDNIQANLHYVDYTNLKKEVERSTDPSVKRWNYKLLEGKDFNTEAIADDALDEHLGEAERKIGIQDTKGSALTWWQSLRNSHSADARDVLRVCGWLAAQKASISELFLSFIYANTENMQAILHYLLYSRLKKAGEKETGNTDRPARTDKVQPPDDSSSLTFVRCPSCKSLVPVSSTRCRMCGHILKSPEAE